MKLDLTHGILRTVGLSPPPNAAYHRRMLRRPTAKDLNRKHFLNTGGVSRSHSRALAALAMALALPAAIVLSACPKPLSTAPKVKSPPGPPKVRSTIGMPSDVRWLIEIADPKTLQRSLGEIFVAADGPGRLLEGVNARLSTALGISPTSSLLFAGAGVRDSVPILVAARAGRNDYETIVSVGISNRDRFLRAVAGALGDDVAPGPRLGNVTTLMQENFVAALVFVVEGRAVVWLSPSDPLADAALLQWTATQDEAHPLFADEIEVLVDKTRSKMNSAGNEIFVARGNLRTAARWSETLYGVIADVPFAQAALVATNHDGAVRVQGHARYDADRRERVFERFANARPPQEACALDDYAALFVAFPVALGVEEARTNGAPLPSPDRLKGSAAIALYPHPNANEVGAGTSILQAGTWAFAGSPLDDTAQSAIDATMEEGGMATLPPAAGLSLRATEPILGDQTKVLSSALAPDVLLLALGAPPAFSRAIDRRTRGVFAPGCADALAGLHLSVDGDVLAQVARRSTPSPFTRLAGRVAASVARAAAQVRPEGDGLAIDVNLQLRPPLGR